MSNERTDDYIYFILDKSKEGNASYGFTGYSDKFGVYQFVPSALKNKYGDPIPKKYRFTSSHKTIKVHKDRIDEVTFLTNHPSCEGSTNAEYRSDGVGGKIQLGVSFRKMNTEADAELANDRVETKIAAMNKVVEIGKDKILTVDFARSLGYRTTGHQTALIHLYKFAEQDPDKFLLEINAPELNSKILFFKALEAGVIVKNNIIYRVEGIDLGVDVPAAIKKIHGDEEVRTLIEHKLKGSSVA
jgi:hypothetical protein